MVILRSLSSTSYLSNYYNSKHYVKVLKKNINESETYRHFCTNICKIDKRYKCTFKEFPMHNNKPSI